MPKSKNHLSDAFSLVTAPDEKLLGDYTLEHYNDKASKLGNDKTTRLICTDNRIVFIEQQLSGDFCSAEHQADCIIDTEWKYSYKPPDKDKKSLLPLLGFLFLAAVAAVTYFGLTYIFTSIIDNNPDFILSEQALKVIAVAITGFFGLLSLICLIIALWPCRGNDDGSFAFELTLHKLKGGSLSTQVLKAGAAPPASASVPPADRIKFTTPAKKMISELGAHLNSIKKGCYKSFAAEKPHNIVWQTNDSEKTASD